MSIKPVTIIVKESTIECAVSDPIAPNAARLETTKDMAIPIPKHETLNTSNDPLNDKIVGINGLSNVAAIPNVVKTPTMTINPLAIADQLTF